MNLGLLCLLECMANVTASVIYVIIDDWIFGKWLCYVNSFFMEVVPVIYTLLLVILTSDRAQALKDPLRYKKNISSNGTRFLAKVIFIWIIGLGSGAILLTGYVESWPFPVRYSCQVSNIKYKQ